MQQREYAIGICAYRPFDVLPAIRERAEFDRRVSLRERRVGLDVDVTGAKLEESRRERNELNSSGVIVSRMSTCETAVLRIVKTRFSVPSARVRSSASRSRCACFTSWSTCLNQSS